MSTTARIAAVLAVAGALGCSNSTTPYTWNLPEGFPLPLIPADNPMTNEKVELGRYLFYEKRLSGNQTYACSSCHQQRLAFSDGRVTPIGSTGEQLPHNAMPLINAGYESFFMWSNPLLQTLEEQALVPMFSDAPVEMGMSESTPAILYRLQSDSNYVKLFRAAFPDQGQPISITNVVLALASFERTMVSGHSPYDRFQYQGDTTAMSDSAQRGMAAFFTEKFDCYHCHAGTTFTTSFVSQNAPTAPRDFRNTGLYNINGTGDYPPGDTGLIAFTDFSNDMGKFKIPTLRNVELTAPYFHDGSAATLDDVLDNYAHGGRLISTGPYAGNGATSVHRDPLVKGFTMSDQEKQDMIAFLKSLTDTSYINDQRFANPSCPDDLPQSCPQVVPSYQNDVAPIVQRSCAMECHSAGHVAANRALPDYQSLFNLKDAALNNIAVCNMPPPIAMNPLGEADRATLMNWLVCGAPNN
ncbi:MAG TPA: MbnH family di-heme enzyme [Polyangia bacterium]|nr:MbnH family di-heme enzyme [Polyangia bacterium]